MTNERDQILYDLYDKGYRNGHFAGHTLGYAAGYQAGRSQIPISVRDAQIYETIADLEPYIKKETT